MSISGAKDSDIGNRESLDFSLSNYLWIAFAIGSMVLTNEENIGVIANQLVDVIAGSVGSALVVDLFYKARERKNEIRRAKQLRIDNGTEVINRLGEQTLVFGGNGSFVVDHMAISDPEHIIPVFNTHEAAQVINRLIPDDNEAKYLNLGVAGDGITVIDTPNLELLNFKVENAILTENGEKKAVMVSVGNIFPTVYGLEEEGIDDPQAMVLQSRLVEKLEPVVGSADNCATIRLNQMYEFPGNRAVGDVLTTRRSDWEVAMVENKNMGRVLLLDPWAIVMRNLYETAITIPGSRNDARVGVVLETDSLSATLPFAEDFGVQFLGKDHRFNTLVSVRNFFIDKRKGVMVNLVMERTDEAVLAKVMKKQPRVSQNIEENFADLTKQEDIYVFQTERAADIARQLGALNVVCVAECVSDMVKMIVSKLIIGDNVVDIQLWVDELHNHQKITRRLEQKRLRPAMDRLDILDTLEETNEPRWWESLMRKEE